jgi:RHS repeat-associated protein
MNFIKYAVIVLAVSLTGCSNPDMDFGILSDESQGGGGLIDGPVRIINGNSLEIRTDLNFGSPFAGGLTFTAIYNSRSDFKGILGQGWTHTYGAVLYPEVTVERQTYLKITDATGRGIYFSQDAENHFQGALHERTHVTRDGEEYFWHRLDGSRQGFDANGRLAWIEDRNANRIGLVYDNQNRLVTVTDEASGRSLTFHYYANGKLEWIQGPETQAVASGRWVDYQYNAAGRRLERVTYADGSVVAYGYDDPFDANNITSKRDAADHLLARWSFDREDRCIEAFQRSGTHIRMDYSEEDRVVVYDAYDQARTFTLTDIGERKRVSQLEGPGACSFCFGDAVQWQYDDEMNLTEVVSVSGAVTRYGDFDARGNPATVTTGEGTAYERSLAYNHHPRLKAPLSMSEASLLGDGWREIVWDFDDDGNDVPNENPTNRVYAIIQRGYTLDIDEQVVPYEYRTSYTYTTKGRVETIDGPLAGNDDRQVSAYDPQTGDLLSVTQPLIGSTTYSDYNAAGWPRRITDVNDVVKDIVYDGRGRRVRIENQADGSSVETLYDESGQLESTRDADNVSRSFQYEGEHGRLEHLLDADGNHVDYAYEPLGRPTQSAVYDASNQQVLLKRWSYQHPSYPGRLYQEINPDETATTYEYYTTGSLQSKTDPKNLTTTYVYDVFNRLREQAEPGNVVTQYNYDRHGNLVSIIDAQQHETTYRYDDAGRRVVTTSPDTGNEYRAYDEAGRLRMVKDARDITTTYSYDALNRLTAIAYPESGDHAAYTLGYTYDEGDSGMGRLTGISDLSGNTRFDYSQMDSQGLLAKIATINGNSFTTTQDTSPGGRIVSLTYPSGRTVTYARDNLGQLTSIVTAIGGAAATLVENLVYSPFGPATNMNLPSIGAVENRLDLLQRQEYSNPNAGSGQGYRDYLYDANSNLESIAAPNDTGRSQSFGYSPLNRLASATGSYGSLIYAYDGVGNRETRTLDGQTDSYAYLTGSNRIDTISGSTTTAFGYDARGNTTTRGALNLTYDQSNRLVTAGSDGNLVGEYVYNGLGQRVVKNVGGVTTYYHYDLQGNLIAETPPDAETASGSEYIYHGLTVMAKADIGTSEIYTYHVNHLGTPEFMTDASGAVVWQATVKPFGEVAVHEKSSIENPIRFPGHYADRETGLHYNYNRYYDPQTGRYLTADPMGLADSPNPYLYVHGNPVNGFDPLGLRTRGVFGGGSLALWKGIDVSVAVLFDDTGDWTIAGDLQITSGPQISVDPSLGIISAPDSRIEDIKGLSKRLAVRLEAVSVDFAVAPDDATKVVTAIDFCPGLIDLGVGSGEGYTLYPQDIPMLIEQTLWAVPHITYSLIKASSPMIDLIDYIATQGFHPVYDPGLPTTGYTRQALLGPTIPFEYVPFTDDVESLTWPVSGGGAIAVSNDGAVYVSTSYGLEKFDDQGNLLDTWEARGTEPGQFNLIDDLETDSEGFVYVIDLQHVDDQQFRLQKFDAEGGLVDSWNVRTNHITIHDDIVYGGVNSLYRDQYMIETFDTSGNYLGGWGTLVPLGSGTTGCEDYTETEFNAPWGLFVDADRNRLLVSDSALEDVRVMDLVGNVQDRWGHCSRAEDGLFSFPRDLVVDNEGVVYVVDDQPGPDTEIQPSTIKVLDSVGNYMHSWGEFEDVRAMTIDPQGYIYFVDLANNLAYKVHSSVIKNNQDL